MSDLLNKNLANIQESPQLNLFGVKEEKLSMRDRIGFVPISVWEPDWSKVKQLKEIIGDSGETRQLVGKQMKLMGSKYSTSIFNPHLAQMILSAYCPTKANIYDPFGGGGTRGFIAVAMGHNYTGVEIRQEEVNRIKEQQQKLNKHFKIICADSQYFPLADNYFDFSYTCPPYYNLEVYSKLPNDLSNAKTFGDFITMLKKCMGWVYKGLKTNCLSVWIVGNFRNNKGELIPFNSYVVSLGIKAGFRLHDELIFWGASKCAAQRAGQFEANRKSVRVHEYIIIFKK